MHSVSFNLIVYLENVFKCAIWPLTNLSIPCLGFFRLSLLSWIINEIYIEFVRTKSIVPRSLGNTVIDFRNPQFATIA